MVTQRTCPRLALIGTEIDKVTNQLLISCTGKDNLSVPLDQQQYLQFPRTVSVWGEECDSFDTGDKSSLWMYEVLGIKGLRLVRFADHFTRPCDPQYAPHGQTAFSDGFPFLLTSSSSLEVLNSKLTRPVSMIRFRPNIVVTGSDAFEEDNWTRIRIQNTVFEVVKPCSRCKVPTIDPDTATLDPHGDNEPSETLKTFRGASALGFTHISSSGVSALP